MTARPAAKGWCPGAYRPMESGDGLIVRVRPVLARLDRRQVEGLCEAALAFGSGIIDLTSRANLQLRGVRPGTHQPLIDALWSLDLLDGDPALESRRNVIVAPLWRAGDETERLARALIGRLAELPDLPAKFGFAIDAGPAPVLGGASADIRIEHGAAGGLILRADGTPAGFPVGRGDAVDAVLALARWFAKTADNVGRMARHPGLAEVTGTERPAPPAPLPGPGPTPLGPAWGVAFGQIDAEALRSLMQDSGAEALRVTPGRCLIAEGGQRVPAGGFLDRPDDPLLAVDACPGAPFCASATVETRALARRLAPVAGGSLHVSGCAKGCARPRAAAVTLVGRDGRYDLVKTGAAWDAPARTGLGADEIASLFGATHAPV